MLPSHSIADDLRESGSVYAGTVCVYCGGADGCDGDFLLAAATLGETLASHSYRIIYGGGRFGLMGAVSSSAMRAGGEVIGVAPHFLRQREGAGSGISQYICTPDMHQRKLVMCHVADIFIILPGGVGTLDEFFEALSWRSLGLHAKSVILLNVKGYWDNLLGLLEHVDISGFGHADFRSGLVVAGSVCEIPNLLTEHLNNG